MPAGLSVLAVASLTFAAIGDAGEAGSLLQGVAHQLVERYSAGSGRKLDALLFLGDNFYPIGLNGLSDAEAEERVKYRVRWPFGPVLDALGRANVHAVTGNHDYYAQRLFKWNRGFTDRGNALASRLGPWTYHYGCEPGEALYDLPGTNARVQLLFFDSARLVAGQECPSSPYASLTRLLKQGAKRDVVWRLVAVHHPLETVGKHGSCRSQCADQDLRSDRYQEYVRGLRDAIRDSEVPVQLVLGGHDHSLQLLASPPDAGCAGCPTVNVVSGAGAKVTKVEEPHPAALVFTAAEGSKDVAPGRTRKARRAVPGFVEVNATLDRLTVRFVDGRNGEELDMGGGRRRFEVDRAGRLVREER